DERRARDRAGEFLDSVCLAGAADEIAGGRLRPGLPLQIIRLDRLAETDFRFRDQDVDRWKLRNRRRRGLFAGSAGEICCKATSAEGDAQDNNTCPIHTLHFPHYAATLLSPWWELTSYSSKHG